MSQLDLKSYQQDYGLYLDYENFKMGFFFFVKHWCLKEYYGQLALVNINTNDRYMTDNSTPGKIFSYFVTAFEDQIKP